MQVIKQPDPVRNERLLDEKEVAYLLGISVRFLQTDRSSKVHQVPYFRVGSRIRYRVSEVREWLERHAVRATGDDAP